MTTESERFRKVYQVRGSGAGGYYQGIDLWRDDERYGSGAAAITLMGRIGVYEDGEPICESMTVPVDRVEDLIEALKALRDEIVAEDMIEETA